MKGFCWSCQAAEHTHPHAAWSYWRNVCWCRPTCQSERWQTPPWSLSGPAAALCPERTYHSASSLWPLPALRFVFMTCEHSCWLANKADVTQIWPRSYSTWLFSWPGVPLSPAAAMYVLPIVLIFSTPLNFGLDSSCLVRETQKGWMLWRNSSFLFIPEFLSMSSDNDAAPVPAVHPVNIWKKNKCINRATDNRPGL